MATATPLTIKNIQGVNCVDLVFGYYVFFDGIPRNRDRYFAPVIDFKFQIHGN